MGFPSGNALGQVHTTHRGIVSAWTSIATLAGSLAGLDPRIVRQLRDGAFKVMQLDAIAYPGNSGGPVLDVEHRRGGGRAAGSCREEHQRSADRHHLCGACQRGWPVAGEHQC
ncbi:hypothetical protein ACG02S_01880 [Roseateles sp. DC23W]|uniref:Uncharacterized protein n=1 Tax=Pelomonas dachongensis TaxID=3299029 RepID=A0ABW7EK13_9BURK